MNIVADTKQEFISGLTPSSIYLNQEAGIKAQETISTTKLPTTRIEAWKYTRLAKIGKINFSNEKSSLTSIANYNIDSDAFTLVFVNGHYSSELSNTDDYQGFSIKKLSDCDSSELPKSNLKIEGELFNAINTNFLNDGVLIDIPNKSIVNRTIQILHILEGNQTISNFRTIVKAGAFSKASIIQGFFSENAEKSFANNVTEAFVGENAFLTIDKVQSEDQGNFHISTEQIDQEKDSTFTINTLTLNGSLVRNNLNINVNGQNCTSNLNGAYLLKEKQHVDNHTVVDHKVPNCESNELYKGVIDDQSTAVFNGKVFVRKDAQKINAFQSNGNVLLSDNSTVNSKPELEIYADDVKCSHGSTTGQLDEEAVFYLRARGLSEKSARHLMVSAFIGDVLEKVENEAVLSFTSNILRSRFGWNID
ncbi:MAG: Fe-S cluster assembly protein SufD [Crocinitomicaceae bacterium]|nr:Fe-S cluster assembly protein SufD [Crocinitomicaceae bacterium]